MISHIIPCLNQFEITVDLLDSLRRTTHDDYVGEIILIDNGSWDETAGIYNDYDIDLYVRNSENTGFPHAVNQGILLSKEELICIWNNDMVCSPGWVQAMLSHVQKVDYGMVTGTLTEPHEMALEDFKSFVSSETDNIILDWHKGGPWMFRRELFEKIGLFDEIFFPTQYEDSDIMLRMALAGFKYGMIPGCKIYHHSALTQNRELLPKFGSFDYARENRAKFEAKWGTIHIDFEKAYLTGDYYGEPR